MFLLQRRPARTVLSLKKNYRYAGMQVRYNIMHIFLVSFLCKLFFKIHINLSNYLKHIMTFYY